MRRVGYAYAAVAAVCVAAGVEYAAPVVPALLLALVLTLALAQLPLPSLPARPERRLTPRPRRSELRRHLDRRAG
jgi:hypothetical protein